MDNYDSFGYWYYDNPEYADKQHRSKIRARRNSHNVRNRLYAIGLYGSPAQIVGKGAARAAYLGRACEHRLSKPRFGQSRNIRPTANPAIAKILYNRGRLRLG
jgi:hypothetical protein